MAIQIRDEPKKNYLLIIMEGEYAYSETGSIFDKMLAACEKHQSARVLVDGRKLTGNPTTLERFNFAIQLTVKYFALRMANKIPPIRFGFVANHPIVDPRKIGETVAVNRGLPIKVSTELKDVLDWLNVEEEKGSDAKR